MKWTSLQFSTVERSPGHYEMKIKRQVGNIKINPINMAKKKLIGSILL